MNIKRCMGHISGTWELLLCEYWRKSMIIGEQNTDLKRLTGWLKLRFLTEIAQFHWNQGEEVAHFAWFGEPCMYMQQQAKYKCVKTAMQNKMWKTKYIYCRYYRKKDPNPKKPLWDVPQSQAEAMLYYIYNTIYYM